MGLSESADFCSACIPCGVNAEHRGVVTISSGRVSAKGHHGVLRTLVLALAACFVLTLVACGGAEEREANYRQRGKALFEQGDYIKAALEFRNALQINPISVEAIFYLGRIAEAQGDLQSAMGAYGKVVEQDSKHVQAQLKIGQFSLLADEPDKALEKADLVLEIEPNNADAHALSAAVLLRRGMMSQAEAEARVALAADPANVGATSVLAGLNSRQGHIDEALLVLDAGLKLTPKDEGLRLIKIQILSDAKRFPEVEAVFRELIQIAPANHAYKIDFARLLVSQGRLDEAEAMFREAVAGAPADKGLKMLLTSFLAEQRGWQAAEKELIAYSGQEPEESSYRFRLADLYAATEQRDKARAILRAIIDKDGTGPQGLAARPALARLALREGKIAEAEALVAEVLAIDASNAEALLIRGSIAADRQDYEGAIADLRTILRDQPESVPALTLLAKAYLGNGEPQLAIETYRTLVTVDPANGVARVALAEQLRAAGQREEALRELEAALKVSPDLLPALKGKAIMMIEQGNLAIAESIGKALLERTDGIDSGHVVLGAAAMQKKDYPAAIASLTAALRSEPKLEEALSLLTQAYEAAGQREEAARYLVEAVTRDPADGAALVLLADVQYNLGRQDEAEKSLRQAIAARADWPVPYLKLGSLYEKTGRLPQALKAFQEGVVRAPGSAELLLRSALTQEALADYEGARKGYEAVLKKRPQDLVASNNLAALIADVWPKDTTLMDQARRLAEAFRNSNDPFLLDTLGWIQLRLGNVADASQLLEKASAGSPDQQQIRYHLGLAYQAQGDKSRAKAELQKAVAGTPDYRGLDEARKTLDSI
jgi:tetratricopeptide (TPR) repeat protein